MIELKYGPSSELEWKSMYIQQVCKLRKTGFVNDDILALVHFCEIFVSLNIMDILPGAADQ